MDIETLLREYRENEAILKIKESEIQARLGILRRIEHLKDDVIEGLTFRRPQLDEPPGRDNLPKSKTELIALFLCEYEELEIDAFKASIASEIIELQDVADKLRRKVEPISLAIDGLYERERFVIQNYYVEGLSWYLVKQRYETKYMPISYSGLKDIRKRALEKLETILNAKLYENCTESVQP